MGWVFALFLRPHCGNLYKNAGPTIGHLQQFFFKRQMPDKCFGGVGDARGWN